MPSRGRGAKPPYLAYAGLILLFIVSAGLRFRLSYDQIWNQLHATEVARPPFDMVDPKTTVVRVEPEAAAAGLVVGDVLTAVNGAPYNGVSDLYGRLHQARAGDILTVQVQRGLEAPIRLAPVRTTRATGRDWAVTIVVGVMMPVVCVLLGFYVAFVRIRDPQAWLLLFLLLGFAQMGTFASLYVHDDWLQPISVIYHQSLQNGWPLTMMLFGVYFPERLSYDRRWPWLKWLLIVPLTLHLILNVVMRVVQAHHGALAEPIHDFLDPLDRPLFLLGLIAIGTFFFATGTKLGVTTNRDARRRLSLLLWGAMLSLTPVFVLVLKDFLLRQPRFESTPAWLLALVLLPLFFFPMTLAYLIVVQRAMDVHVMVRQSMQYLLAKNTIRALQMILVSAVIFGAAFLATEDDMKKRPERIQIIAEGLLGFVLVQRIASKLRGWLDRRFFREAYNAEQVLSDLAEKVRTIVETEPLLDTVARRIAESLHVTRVALLLPHGAGGFQPAYALGYTEPPWVSIPENSATTEQLRRERHAQVYPEDETSWIYRPDITDEERRALQNLQSQLLLPLSLNQKLLGILSLGPKQSDAPFTKDDLRLLGSVATQTGLALENSRLSAAVANEIAQRERMNRELEIAREVQERLFPQELPKFAGIDYAGSCRPALVVGGDYYDFIELSPGELGIAIGDVSGKGIPAALLMASLRASLRGQTIQPSRDLARLMANVNRLVYEGSTSNRYATFFYAEYDSAARLLRYVNAGHNPPLVFRQGCEVMRLDIGGPVVGLLPGFPYQQGTIQLHAGDLLVAFTDGISEAMNSADEEWGEARLIEYVRKVPVIPADPLMKRIVAGVDEFVAGAPQHDDMTIIVARIVQ
jgi:phosphoserine phosphatase RsbU/P